MNWLTNERMREQTNNVWYSLFFVFHSLIKEKASTDPKNKKAATGGKQDGAAGKKADAKPAANKKPTQKKKSQLDDKQEYAALRDAIDGEYCHGSVIHYQRCQEKWFCKVMEKSGIFILTHGIFPRRRLWWIIITTLYRLMPQLLYQNTDQSLMNMLLSILLNNRLP